MLVFLCSLVLGVNRCAGDRSLAVLSLTRHHWHCIICCKSRHTPSRRINGYGRRRPLVIL